ncbi:MAG: hypothetical protein DHS20C15_23740 [Planctomycetota bacterium]|nr:MAG: hypothetical protein DHS20C15_23740 [Planctomycetota bacterium]
MNGRLMDGRVMNRARGTDVNGGGGSARRCALALTFVIAALPGCLYVGARGRVGAPIEASAVQQLQIGVSTLDDTLALLGPPDEFLSAEETALLLDERVRLSDALDVARRVDHAFTWQLDRFALDGTWLLLFAWFDIDTEHDMLVVWFDDQARVAAVASTS